jgi:hypothetical protein
MARIVRSCKYLGGIYGLPPMPLLGEGKDRYEDCVGSRLEAFPDNNTAVFLIETDQALPVFLHKLCYDAESVYWLLLYWCLLAKPEKIPFPKKYHQISGHTSLLWMRHGITGTPVSL